MAQYTDPEATCVTPTPTDADPNMVCAHFVGDHGWDDPWKRQPGETTAVFNKRWSENNKSAKAAAEREKAALTRGACHVSTCPCTDFADGSVSQKERDAAATKKEADAEAAFNARVDNAVAAALAARSSGPAPTPDQTAPANMTETPTEKRARLEAELAALAGS